jgi:exopolysaccharide production protein ExoQ
MRNYPRSVVGRPEVPKPQPTPASTLVQDPKGSTGPTFLLCALLLLMILPTDLNYGALITQNSVAEADKSITNKVVLLLILLGSCCYIVPRQRLWLAVLGKINPFYLLFIALAALSVEWSIEPDLTVTHVFRLLVIFMCCTAFTLYGWTATRLQDVMRPLLGAFLVGSVIFALVLPKYGVQQFSEFTPTTPGSFTPSGAAAIAIVKPVLRGLTYGKNLLGPLAGLGVIFWLYAWLNKEVGFFWVLLCGSAALICLYWTHSSTSILASAFAVVAMLMMRHWPRWLRRYMPTIIAMFSLVIFVYSLVILKLIPQLEFLLTPITALTGKDLTFTNRTAIWQIVGEHIAQHPVLGTGYSAYWIDKPDSPAERVKTLLNFYPGESHNGYLDVLNDLGIVGSFCLLGYLVVSLRQSIKIMAFDRNQGALYLVLLFYTFWCSLSESHWFSAESVLFTVFTLAVCTSARTLLQRRFETKSVRAPPHAAPTNRAR